MKWSELAAEPCSVARSVAVIGDRWTLMVVRDCFLGVRRFEDFERRLGISRSIVADRLKRLVEEGVLRRDVYQERPVRHEYRLTNKGLALHPVIMAVVHWGDVYYSGEDGPPLLHRHKTCGCELAPVMTCSACGEAVAARDVDVREPARAG
jgi:DNA-binding HxlR family transcriptional regulator